MGRDLQHRHGTAYEDKNLFYSKQFHLISPYTVEFKWLEQLWNLENLFKSGVVRANGCYSLYIVKRHNRDIFLFPLI